MDQNCVHHSGTITVLSTVSNLVCVEVVCCCRYLWRVIWRFPSTPFVGFFCIVNGVHSSYPCHHVFVHGHLRKGQFIFIFISIYFLFRSIWDTILPSVSVGIIWEIMQNLSCCCFDRGKIMEMIKIYDRRRKIKNEISGR